MFHIGQKVVCVDDDWSHPLRHEVMTVPQKNIVYEVRGFDPSAREADFIWLVEICNPPVYGAEPSFAATSFRPLISRSTESGMSILRGILNGQRIPENV